MAAASAPAAEDVAPGRVVDGAPSGARQPFAIMVVALLLALVVIGVAYAVFAFSSPAPRPSTYPVGTRASAFNLPAAHRCGTRRVPVDHPSRVGRVAVLVVVRALSRRALPSVARRGTGVLDGVRFVGVDGDRTAAAAATFARSANVTFPVGVDALLLVSSRLAPLGTPAVLFVAPSGRVVAADYGVLSDEQLSAGLSALRP